jgi:cytochrome c oxidase assembly protein subunit 15
MAALVMLTLIVFSGAAVRLTGSGLGCPTWPECHGHLVTDKLSTHGWIEYGNRLVTGVVAVLAVLAAFGAYLRRPFRRDLAILGLLLPAGVAVQVVLGGMSVLYGLAPGWVMAHFLTSQLVLAAAIALAWRSRHAPAELARAVEPRTTVLATRALLALAAWVLFLGTVATASGPHPGSSGAQVVTRLSFDGGHTLDFAIHWHGHFSAALGVLAVALWADCLRRGGAVRLRRVLTALCLLTATQGTVGLIQYHHRLPAELVWVHVILATLTWMSAVSAIAAAGPLAPPRTATETSELASRTPSPDPARSMSVASP